MLVFRYFGVPVGDSDEESSSLDDDDDYEDDGGDSEMEDRDDEEDERGEEVFRGSVPRDGPRTRRQRGLEEVRDSQLSLMREAAAIIKTVEKRFVMMALGNSAPCHEIVYERLPGGELIQRVNDEQVSSNRRTEFYITYGNEAAGGLSSIRH